MAIQQQASQQYQTVQALRFLAAALVLVTHAGFYTHERLDVTFQYWRRGSAGVELFFVITGFVLLYSYKHADGKQSDWRIFAARRLARIVPMYWLATGAKIAVLIFASQYVLHADLSLEYAIKSFLFIPSYNAVDGRVQPLLGVGWTLLHEMYFYGLFALAIFLRTCPANFTAAAILLFTAAPILLGPISPEMAPGLYVYCNPINLNFIFGLLVARLLSSNCLLGDAWAFLAVVGGLLSIFFDVFSLVIELPTVVSVGLASFFVLWGATSLEQRRPLGLPKLIVAMGGASYSIYLFHPLIVPIAPIGLRVIGAANGTLSVIVGVLGGLVGTYLIYAAFERPISRVLTSRIRAWQVLRIVD